MDTLSVVKCVICIALILVAFIAGICLADKSVIGHPNPSHSTKVNLNFRLVCVMMACTLLVFLLYPF